MSESEQEIKDHILTTILKLCIQYETNNLFVSDIYRAHNHRNAQNYKEIARFFIDELVGYTMAGIMIYSCLEETHISNGMQTSMRIVVTERITSDGHTDILITGINEFALKVLLHEVLWGEKYYTSDYWLHTMEFQEKCRNWEGDFSGQK